MGPYTFNQFLIHALPTFIDLEQTRKAGETVCQCISTCIQSQITQTSQTSFCDKEISKRWVTNVALKLEDGHFAHGILITPQALHQFSNIDILHGGLGNG